MEFLLAVAFLAVIAYAVRRNRRRTSPGPSPTAADPATTGVHTGRTWATSSGRPDPAVTAHFDRNTAIEDAKRAGRHDQALELARTDVNQAPTFLGIMHRTDRDRARRYGLPGPEPLPIRLPAVELICQLGVARGDRQLVADTHELMSNLPGMDHHAADTAQALADLDARDRIVSLVAAQPGVPTAGLAAKVNHPHPRVRSIIGWLERDQQLRRHQHGSKYRLYLPGDAPATTATPAPAGYPPPPPPAAAPATVPPASPSRIRFVAIDVETATSDRASICAIAAVWVDHGKLAHTGRWLVQPPGNHYDPSNVRTHGIRPDHTADAPRFDVVWDELAPHLHGWPLVAHNAPFDRSAIVASLAATGRRPPQLTMGCTVSAARQAWPDLPNHKLTTVSAHVGRPVVRHHDPAADAEAAAYIAIAICAAAHVPDLGHL